MPDSKYSLDALAQRLKSNYTNCEITQSNGTLTIQTALGELVVTGLHITCSVLGESCGEFSFKTEDDLYEAIESHLLMLQKEEARCNLTYSAARSSRSKHFRRLLCGAFLIHVLLLIAYLWCSLPVLVVLALLCPLAAMTVFAPIQRQILHRSWVCPHCGAPLPLHKSHLYSTPYPVASCPKCGTSLLDPALVEQLRQEMQATDEDLISNAPTSSDLPKPGSRLPGLIWGIFLLVSSLLLLFSFLVLLPESTPVYSVGSIPIIVGVAAAGLALLICRAPQAEPHGRPPEAAVYDHPLLPAIGIILGLFGLFCTFCAILLPQDLVMAFGFFGPIGLGLLLLSVWMLLSRKNRSLLCYSTHLVYTSSFGRVRKLERHQIASVQFTSNGSLRFLDADGKKLCGIESNMPGAADAVTWAERSHLHFSTSKALDQKIDTQEHALKTVSWHTADRTPMHAHLPAIRVGLVVVTLFFTFGSILPLLLYLFADVKASVVIYWTAFSAVPILLYYVLFAPVLLLSDRPTNASREWNQMHIKFPTILVVLLALLNATQIHYLWNQQVLHVVDDLLLVVQVLVLSALLIALFRWRTPKRIREVESLVITATALILVSFSILYAGNLALCKPSKHYPLVVVDRSAPTEEHPDRDRTLTIRLEDGSTKSIPVSEELYDLQEGGTEFVVCQRKSLLGVRMVQLHLPKGASWPDKEQPPVP